MTTPPESQRWQLVPVTPTEEMLHAMADNVSLMDFKRGAEIGYAAMLSTAPKAPAMPDEVYDAMLSTIGAASMYLGREQMKPFLDWLKATGLTKE